MAPTVVGESLKGAFLLAEVFGGVFGLPTNPPSPLLSSLPVDAAGASLNSGPNATSAEGVAAGLVETKRRAGGVGGRTDIVQALELGDRDKLIKFCEAVQLFSPVNAYVRPGEVFAQSFYVFSMSCGAGPLLSEERQLHLDSAVYFGCFHG